MDESPSSSAQSSEYVFPRAHRLARTLTWLYGVAVLLVGTWLIFGLLAPRGVPSIAREWIDGGAGGVVLSALLVAFTGAFAALAMAGTRFRYTLSLEALETGTRWEDPTERRIAKFLGKKSRAIPFYNSIKADPGFVARQGQAIIVTTGAVVVWFVEWLFWPPQVSPTPELANNFGVVVGVALALGFISLVAERFVKEFPEPQLPEVPTVRRLLFFATLVLVAGAVLEMAHGEGVTWVRWLVCALNVLPGLVMLELSLRSLARLFLPPPLPAVAAAATDSLFVALVTGGPRAPSMLLKAHLGLDFSRSWAVAFLSKALLPAAFGTGLLCWGLTGVKLIELGQRGVYERFGAPVAVLGPGLHVLLPWPFGRLLPVDYGTIHSVAIGVDEADTESNAADAEAPAPLSLNRLWETAHAGQAHYLVPSPGTGQQTGQQGFQSVDTEINVLYRIGLSNSAALQSVYAVADPQALIKEDAGRLVLRFFNSRTLDAVIGARRENVADALRDQLAADIDSDHAGIEIVSVLIEEIHPPAGAAAAYHGVQAAQINATASIFDEQGRAELTAGAAQQQAYQSTTAADAKAAEITRAADSAAYRFNADRRAYSDGGKAFLLERYYGNLDAALSKTPVTILDHRLNSASDPILDLRGTAGVPAPVFTPPLVPGIEVAH
jgi:regulator of protease activity HflC (stomatin/prohibitin superfamily)